MEYIKGRKEELLEYSEGWWNFTEDMDLLLWYDLKNMLEDLIWKSQQGYKVVGLKLYESCGVHALMIQAMTVYMLVEKKYPLTIATLTQMLDKKL
ncbi:hypothetical protein Tco_1336268 [Tanacetum coccineum]